VLYIASRIYAAAGLENPNEEAVTYIVWLKTRCKTVPISEELAIKAGELKRRLHIALPDCYVIAAGQMLDATPLFKAIEREMKPIRESLEELGVAFLQELP